MRWRSSAPVIRAAFAGAALAVLFGCITHANSQTLHLHGVTLDAPMAAEEIARVLPGSTCLAMDVDSIETCTAVIDAGGSSEFLTIMLIRGRVGAIVAQFDVDAAERFSRHIAFQLGDGDRVVGQAGEGGQVPLDQIVLTWHLQDGSFARMVKRGPFDASKSAFIALSKPMNAHENAKPLSGQRPGDRCWISPLECQKG